MIFRTSMFEGILYIGITTGSNKKEITGSQKIVGNPECQIFSLEMSNWNSYPRLNGSLGCWVDSNKYHYNQINTYANWDVVNSDKVCCVV